MQIADVAIIGGTGIGERLADYAGESIETQTEHGPLAARLADIEGVRVAVVQRHSGGHKVPPHRVNYKAIAVGLRAMGVKGCVSSAAVGSLRTDWGPGTLAVCDDFIDLTGRRLTLFDLTVRHTDFSDPFPLAGHLASAAVAESVSVEQGAVYVGLDGPRYESPAEIRMVQRLGGDVVGMTASSEAILLREAGVPYGCLAVVTNLGCGLSEATLDHGEVVDVMTTWGDCVLRVLVRAATAVASQQ